MSEHHDLELKRAMDALPRSIEPPENLWPSVRSRLVDHGKLPRARFVVDFPRTTVLTRRLAALLALLALSSGALALSRHASAQIRVHSWPNGNKLLEPGEQLVTGDRWQRVEIGTIGTIEVDSHTTLSIIEARMTSQRMRLSRGSIRAFVDAPPRLFTVETPAGIATDMGCSYTLTVDSAGNTRLEVQLGWVEMNHRTLALVPAGWHVAERYGGSPGTPVRNDASGPLQLAVDAFDATHADSSLSAILRTAGPRDAVTLWHLIGQTGGVRRARVVSRLAELVPIPSGITRQEIESNNREAMMLYWTKLPDTLPIIPTIQAALWRLWLRIGG
ncbi:MAG TPA: hypothetical protein VGI92_04705 [Gemmatimonadales bacterium]|jgi:hypothetical protein